MTKKSQLLEWCRQKRIFSTVDVREWGTRNFFLRAERQCRQLAQDGQLSRLTNEEIILRGLHKNGNTMIGYWEVA